MGLVEFYKEEPCPCLNWSGVGCTLWGFVLGGGSTFLLEAVYVFVPDPGVSCSLWVSVLEGILSCLLAGRDLWPGVISRVSMPDPEGVVACVGFVRDGLILYYVLARGGY